MSRVETEVPSPVYTRGPNDYLRISLEQFWVDLQPFLLRRGYRLRPRYSPDWKPSWLQVEVKPGETRPHPSLFEDSLGLRHTKLLDAVRIADGQKVVLKRVETRTDEIQVGLLFSSERNRKDPRNCCVPILDVVMIPSNDDEALLVMPQLLCFDLLPYRFLGEFAEFALQIVSGIEFMHELNVAHRDACWFNIMMDSTKVIPKGHHFCRWNSHNGITSDHFEWNTRWSVRPVKYYFIDFEVSSLFTTKEALVVGTITQDKTVPELSLDVPYDPFKLDIYHVGNVLSQCIKRHTGLSDYRKLAALMTAPDSKCRPSAAECVEICKRINDKITKSRRLKSRIWRKKSDLYRGRSPIYKLAVILGWMTTM